ncbi:Threonine/homoserine/homoserine lactone efflux protein [Desulfuromusa kysingii]|uniref:Threonine/homoserine/homoserine lactone efflux protein n=1 Tax=Desulfuromusa kysingii TaxID=37625 RepID=A0A1H4DBJ3_9BACT|nr:LysE family transporter [Desulfuromusa kysingii]SEA70094.1 Threonine/homoserine/homoserine lactone efflux protein [Desulfuromusa kysingii]
MISFLAIGTILGLSAGFAPGPLLALVISESLHHNIRSGVKVALSPIVTDLPIILVAFFVFAKLSDFNAALGAISLGGGFFLLLTGYQSLKMADINLETTNTRPTSLAKGILTNLLSPHPYLFWLTVGAPTMVSAVNQQPLAGAAFLGGFYVCLVGSKVIVAILTGKSKTFLTGNSYRAIIRCLGFVIIILAGKLFYDGLKLLQILA